MALAVDCDPGQSSPFKADWDSVGQCEMDWDNAYPLDLHGIGIAIGSSWHWHRWVDWDSWNPGTILDLRHWTGAICKSMDTHWISMALASLGRLGSWTIFTLQGRVGQRGTV